GGVHAPRRITAVLHRLFERRFLIGDEVEDVDFSGGVEMLRDLEQLYRQQGVQALLERRLAPVERQLRNVAEEHVLVEAAELIEEDAGPQLVVGGVLQSPHEDLARGRFADGGRQRFEYTAKHVVVGRDDLQQLG